MKESEIFMLLNKILSKVEHIETKLVVLESKLGANIPKVENTNTIKKRGDIPDIKKEIDKIRQEHFNNFKIPTSPDLTGVPGISGGMAGVPDLTGLTTMIKGLPFIKNEIKEIIDAGNKEVKDEEPNK